jgi:hypothetical protein
MSCLITAYQLEGYLPYIYCEFKIRGLLQEAIPDKTIETVKQGDHYSNRNLKPAPDK